MKTINNIPTSKIERASKLLKTGAKVGINYIKYYGDKIVNDEKEAKQRLEEANAEDVYDSLKELKGSALKVAQMMSMEKNLLPKAYVDKFSLAQFSVPALSYPLIVKTFRRYFQKAPSEIYDTFTENSVNAASIGQVHKATLKGKELAVKIQYPGVAESISTDLAMVKPFAMKMLNIKGKEFEVYFKEVEGKLIEETDYELELKQSELIANASSHIPNLLFPNYYKELSSERIITMDWMNGIHLSEFTAVNEDSILANKVGQTLWDFYMFQIHSLKKVHADPHPGNFLVSDKGEFIVIDFGCIKEIPSEFYEPYFQMTQKSVIDNPVTFEKILFDLEIVKSTDTSEEKEFFMKLFHELLSLLTKPFHSEVFDFSDKVFFNKIVELANNLKDNPELRKLDANRGSKHFIYINRVFFGLYNLLNDLKASEININNYKKYLTNEAK